MTDTPKMAPTAPAEKPATQQQPESKPVEQKETPAAPVDTKKKF
jgi:hypothetical protein